MGTERRGVCVWGGGCWPCARGCDGTTSVRFLPPREFSRRMCTTKKMARNDTGEF